jgi:hypothetical protein
LRLTSTELAQIIIATLLGGSVFLGMLTAALRFGVRPLLEDWAKIRSQLGTQALERRMLEVEEEIRLLRANAGLQLPADSFRLPDRPRT